MKKVFSILGNLDRRIIFLLIGLAVLIPLIKPNWVQLPIKIDNNTQIVYDSISELKEGDKVLLSFAYGASTMPEVHPMAIALLNHLFSKGVKVFIVSLWPEGPIMAKQAISSVNNSDIFDLSSSSCSLFFKLDKLTSSTIFFFVSKYLKYTPPIINIIKDKIKTCIKVFIDI